MFFFMTLPSCTKTDIVETDGSSAEETSELISMNTETVTDTSSEKTEEVGSISSNSGSGIENDENSGSNNG